MTDLTNYHKIKHLFTPPFKPCPMGLYVFDAHQNMAASLNIYAKADDPDRYHVRGWGRISDLPNAEELMYAWECVCRPICQGLILDAPTMRSHAQEISNKLNQIWYAYK